MGMRGGALGVGGVGGMIITEKGRGNLDGGVWSCGDGRD